MEKRKRTYQLTHALKTDPFVFEQVWKGKKPFEIRKNDRDFQIGDLLILKETKFSGEEMAKGSPLIYTGRRVEARISCIIEDYFYGIRENFCVIGLVDIKRRFRSTPCTSLNESGISEWADEKEKEEWTKHQKKE